MPQFNVPAIRGRFISELEFTVDVEDQKAKIATEIGMNHQNELEKERDACIAKFLDATYGLWNALLTVNGIILAMFATLSGNHSPNNAILILAVITASVISSCVLVLNYVMRRQTYHYLVGILSDTNMQLTEKQRNKNIKDAVARGRLGEKCENVAIVLFLIEAVCIMKLVLTPL